MRIKVKAFGDLNTQLGNETIIEIKDNATVDSLLSKLSMMTRTYKKGYIGDHQVGSDLAVLINGKNVDTLTKSRSLKEGDVIDLIPFTVGG
jgi:molybdopterin converting factor small subunit